MEFYFRRPRGIADLDMIDTDHVATQISDLLTPDRAAVDVTGQTPGPAWPDNPTAAGRAAVITATELLGITLNIGTYDALTLLRARAYADDRSVDALADDVLRRRIAIDDFRP